MSDTRSKSPPRWQPERVWEQLVEDSGRSSASLEAEIRAEALRLEGEGHLTFETLRRSEFDVGAARHLDSCGFCKDLHELMHPPEAVLQAAFGARLQHNASTAEGSSRVRGTSRRRHIATAVTAFVSLLVGGLVGGYFQERRSVKLRARKT